MGITPEVAVASFIAALERGDPDGALTLMAPDCEYDNVPIGKAIGHHAIREMFALFVAPGDEVAVSAGIDVRMVRFEIVRQVAQGHMLFNERIDHLLVGGKPVAMAVVGVWETDPETGKITLWRDYFDMGQITSAITSDDPEDVAASLRERIEPPLPT
jgi:limonene-1,2-epoxide hydrolase